MTQRLNPMQHSGEAFQKFLDFGMALRKSSIEEKLRDLVDIRASQMNGCGFCLDMHVKEAKLHGERDLRVHHVAVWRESTLFNARERAALAWTEVLTRLPEHGVPDDVYKQVREQLSEREISDLENRLRAKSHSFAVATDCRLRRSFHARGSTPKCFLNAMVKFAG